MSKNAWMTIAVASVIGLALVSWASTASGGVTNPGPGVEAWRPGAHMGFQYCSLVSTRAQLTSWSEYGIGCALGVLGALLVAVGSIIGPGRESANVFAKNRGLLLSAAGAVALVAAKYALSRADAASLLSASATTIIADSQPMSAAARTAEGTTGGENKGGTGGGGKATVDKDWAMYSGCLTARAAWLKSRVDSGVQFQTALSRAESGKNGNGDTPQQQ